MQKKFTNSFDALRTFSVSGSEYALFDLKRLEELKLCRLERLPYSIRVLLENVLRNEDNVIVTEHDVKKAASYQPDAVPEGEVPYMPSRVIMQDFTGVPAVVDLACMRDAVERLGGDAEKINPLVRTDLVIDHSIQVDSYGSCDALGENMKKEYERNTERYTLLKWAQKSFRNMNIVPPGTGIIHQVNLEYLAHVVTAEEADGRTLLFPDTLVGTDSHTTMINGLSVLGWGVGGIEAEAVILGQPYYMLLPEVVGVKLHGELPDNVTATDLVLTVTQKLREHGVVGKFVEYFGPGLATLDVADRAVLANMAPEYGATMGFFPVDAKTIEFLRLTGRDSGQAELVEAYTKEQQLFRSDDSADPVFSCVLEIDMAAVVPCIAGPRKPHERIALTDVLRTFASGLCEPADKGGLGVDRSDSKTKASCEVAGETAALKHGSVVLAAVTSCTNTSNPALMIAAGLVAQKAIERGLSTKPWIKTSLAPGSRVVTDYLQKSGLLAALEKQRFHLVGYGCTSCIGNSGDLPEPVAQAIREKNLVTASVVSGNRNFEGRIHPLIRANYLASPPLVVAYALCGSMDIDLAAEPLGTDASGNDVFLKDIWPQKREIEEAVSSALSPDMFRTIYGGVLDGDDDWRALAASPSRTYMWDAASTYIKSPPFFEGMARSVPPLEDIEGARVLALLGDFVTTDHISPAGAIAEDGPAARYLQENGIPPDKFNSFGSRRGNHEVMMRGTFANIRLKNLLAPGTEGGVTRHLPGGEQMSIYDAAMKYQAADLPLIVIGGKLYGSGSSRDWAAKGPALLGVRAVIAESFERIHRSNLVGMGVLPLQFLEGENRGTLGLTGTERYTISGIAGGLTPGGELSVTAASDDDTISGRQFKVLCRLDTRIDIDYYRNGGILQTVLRKLTR